MRSNLAGCDEAGRQLAHMLGPPATRPTAAGPIRNASSLILRRRLRELACEHSVVLSVLPEQPAARSVEQPTNQTAGTVLTQLEAAGVGVTLASADRTVLQAILAPAKQDRQVVQMLRHLASMPLTRQVLPLGRWLALRKQAHNSSVDHQREATDIKCIEHLFEAATK